MTIRCYYRCPIVDEKIETHFDKWLFALKNLHKLTNRPRKLQEKIFLRLLEQAEIAQFDEKEYNAYEESLKAYRDLKNSLDTAFDEGKIEGKIEEKIEIAKIAKAKGFSFKDISEMTGLSIEEIERL